MAEKGLDRTRPYGHILPPNGEEHYVQDYRVFNNRGEYLRSDGAPPPRPISQPTTEGPRDGALSISEAQVTLEARPLLEWQTMNYSKLCGLLWREKQFKSPNKVAALNFLKSLNLITEE